jgi:hypothetical protein
MEKLFNYYSFDECPDEDILFEKLNQLVDEEKIQYSEKESYLIKIDDLELSDTELEELSKFLDDNNVYPYLGYEEEDDDYESNFGDFDDYEDY